MAHGSKRWIVCFDGHLKKSNDRTKKDYYRGLRRWEPYEDTSNYIARYRYRKDFEFCPQCKHNYKPIKAHNDALTVERKKLEAEWDRMHQKEIDAYEAALVKWRKEQGLNYSNFIFQPRDPRWDYKLKNGISRYDYVRRHMIDYPIRDEECYLCPKHRRYFDEKSAMWHRNVPGRKATYQYTVRQDYKYHKNEVKNIMDRAKYDEEYYDDIPKYKRGWLD